MSPTRRAGMHAAVLAALEDRRRRATSTPGDWSTTPAAPATRRRCSVTPGSPATSPPGRAPTARPPRTTWPRPSTPTCSRTTSRRSSSTAPRMECYLVGRFQESLDLWRRGADLRERMGDREGWATTCAGSPVCSGGPATPRPALEVSERAIEVLEALPPSPALAQAYGQLARLHNTAHRAGDTLHYGRKSVDAGRGSSATPRPTCSSGIALATARVLTATSAVQDLADLRRGGGARGLLRGGRPGTASTWRSMTPDELAEYGPVAERAVRHLRAVRPPPRHGRLHLTPSTALGPGCTWSAGTGRRR